MWEEVVFDLMAQVAGHDVEQAASAQVAGAGELANVPVTPGLVAAVFRAVESHSFGEVPTKDHHMSPEVVV